MRRHSLWLLLSGAACCLTAEFSPSQGPIVISRVPAVLGPPQEVVVPMVLEFGPQAKPVPSVLTFDTHKPIPFVLEFEPPPEMPRIATVTDLVARERESNEPPLYGKAGTLGIVVFESPLAAPAPHPLASVRERPSFGGVIAVEPIKLADTPATFTAPIRAQMPVAGPQPMEAPLSEPMHVPLPPLIAPPIPGPDDDDN